MFSSIATPLNSISASTSISGVSTSSFSFFSAGTASSRSFIISASRSAISASSAA
jgi:hypothetical protein